MKQIYVIAFLVLSSFQMTAQASPMVKENKTSVDKDSLAFVNASWEISDLGRGAKAMYAQIPMFYSTQSVCVVKYPMKKFRTDILHRPKESAGKPSEIGREVGAAFALNGGYFHVKQWIPSVYFRE